MRKGIYIWLSVLLLIQTSCTEDDARIALRGEGEKVSVTLNFRIPAATAPSEKPETRSVAASEGFTVCFEDHIETPQTRSDGTTALHNLWVMQFDAEGNKVASQKMSDATTVVNDMAILDANLVVGTNQSLYIVVQGKLFNNDLSQVATISDLESLDLGYIQTSGGSSKSKITSDEEIPYAGRMDGVDIFKLENDNKGYIKYNQPSGFDGGIEIQRLAAKISITYKYDVIEHTFTSLTLTNVCANMTVKPGAAATPSYVAFSSTAIKNNGDDTFTVTWYVAPNMKGTVDSVGSESDRNSTNAPANATMIQVAAQETAKPANYMMYEIYVGGNNTNNFDIQHNTIYNLTTEINAAPVDAVLDGRVTSVSIKPDIQLHASARTGSGSTSPSGVIYDIDSHYDFRPLSIFTASSSIKVEIVDAGSGTSWIKLSSAKNYTLAKQNTDFSTSAEATLIGPGNLNFYLYCDEYVDHTAIGNRSATVRVTIQSVSGGTENVNEFTLSQRPAIYLGRLGGVMGTDGYTAGLVVDQINESEVRYRPTIPLIVGAGIPGGYYNQSINDYAANKWYGRESTRLMAENPNAIKVEDGLSIETHKPITDANGNLYQYTYYNTYAARFCYDRNRDENGNGLIDADELKWYLPAQNQLQGAWVLSENSNIPFITTNHWTATQNSATNNWYVNFQNGNSPTTRKTGLLIVRCVRDITGTF